MALPDYSQTTRHLFREVQQRKRIEQDLRDAKVELERERNDLDDLVAKRTGELVAQFEEMKGLNQQLTQINQEQAEFTYAISHDLMSPLNTIRMMLSFLEEDLLGDAGPHILEPLEAARITAARMLAIVEDVLTYSRSIGQPVAFEPVDLNGLLADILFDLKGDLERNQAKVDLDPLPTMDGMKVQLRILLQNLLSNALKFRHPDRAPHVRVTAIPTTEDTVEISVSDNGIGVDQQHYERIFGLFQRLHNFEEYSGTGLGLTLCQRIARNHGGEITVSSQCDKGSTFTVTMQIHEQNKPRNPDR
ncbi:MAG: ATP-binding protein [Pseudomonadota bacterium]